MNNEQSALPGCNVMLMGPSGTGKTHAIGTLVDQGIETFFFAFEAGADSLRGYYTDNNKLVPSNLHFITVKAQTASWGEMADMAGSVNRLAYDSLKKMKDPNKSKYTQFETFLRTFNEVTDDNGNKFGCIDEWGPDRAVVIDGLTGLSDAAMAAVIGGKVDRDQKDWGLAQGLLYNFITKICDNSQHHFIMIAHVEREVDQILGGVKLMVSTLGKALPPKLPAKFSDVILTVRNGTKWNWDTASAIADVKTRNLPIKADNQPDFGLIIDKWKSRGGRC